MKKIFALIVIPLLVLLVWVPQPVMAQTAGNCGVSFVPPNPTGDRAVKFVISGQGFNFNPAESYRLYLNHPRETDPEIPARVSINNGKLEFSAGGQGEETRTGLHTLVITQRSDSKEVCRPTYRIGQLATGCLIEIEPSEPGLNDDVKVSFSNLPKDQDVGAGGGGLIRTGWFAEILPDKGKITSFQRVGDNFEAVAGGFTSVGAYTIELKSHIGQAGIGPLETVCRTVINVTENGGSRDKKVVKPGDSPTSPTDLKWCGGANNGLETGLGCIPVGDTNQFVGWFLKWALGISGGIAFLLMIIAGFQIMTSTGNPDKIQGGKELLNAAISGLVLIIFSLFLLKLIGVDILGLPGFGS